MFRRRSQASGKAVRPRDRLAGSAVEMRAPEPGKSAREILLSSWPGRILLISAAARLLAAPLQSTALGSRADVLSTAATIGLAFALSYFLIRLIVLAKRRLLWRVRRKLIISYVFIGLIPALLLVAFFMLAGLLMFRSVGSYLFQDGLGELVDSAQLMAETTVAELQRAGLGTAPDVLARRVANASRRYPGLSIAVLPVSIEGRVSTAKPVVAGSWRHAAAPAFVPMWVSPARGFAGTVVYDTDDSSPSVDLVVRAVRLPDATTPAFGVLVDLPLDDEVREWFRDRTGIKIGDVSVSPLRAQRVSRLRGAAADGSTAGGWRDWLENWVAFADYVDWDSGRAGNASVAVRVGIGDIYARLSQAQPRVGSMRLGDLFLVVLVVIAGLFLVIEVVALIMGFALAKSITGSIHELFMGTERVRQGDFGHRINVRTRDQLGELADSFNQMTGSIENLLVQAAEKKRLEEELRIAREIQMSLLPRGPLLMPGLAITALCVPAREVGGDYYDFFPLGDRKLGVLIADVSGKGTSAALYMAELKGLMLSLSQIYHSPKQLLMEVNRIISDNLDSRSFITMMYAVVDLESQLLTYARAGHTPLIYVPSGSGSVRQAQVLAPDGLVLGLRIDGIEEKFEQLLIEETIPLSPGDVFVLFTDGVTEAMNRESDLFGEARLSTLVEEHGHLPADQLRERILREVEAFVAGADQHDDMTMILLKVEELGASEPVRVGSSAERLAQEGARARGSRARVGAKEDYGVH